MAADDEIEEKASNEEYSPLKANKRRSSLKTTFADDKTLTNSESRRGKNSMVIIDAFDSNSSSDEGSDKKKFEEEVHYETYA